jgi:hypothetical protein
MLRSILLLFFSFSFFVATAQEEVDDYYHSEIDEVVVVDSVSQNRYSGQTSFSTIDTNFYYQIYFIPRDTAKAWASAKRYAKIADATEQLKAWKESETNKKPRSQKTAPSWTRNLFNGNFATGILWILAAFFVGFIIYKLILNKGFFTRDFASKKVEKLSLTDDELFLQQDFASLAKSFEDRQDLRSAMRFNFLFTLNKMKERGLIEFKIEKTNKKYITELDGKFRPAFAKLARYYEYAWYGKMPISDSDYQIVKKSFQEFNSII